MSVKRIYVEKKPDYAVEASQLLWEIRHILGIASVQRLRLLNRYDVEGVSDELFARCLGVVFSEKQVDDAFEDLPGDARAVFAVEYLPGQYDQRAASCEECIQLVGQCERPSVRSARVYLLYGDFTAEELSRIKHHVINPVDSREASLATRETLSQRYPEPEDVPVLTGFTRMEQQALAPFVRRYELAMDEADLAFCRDYFASEGRDPTLTELRMIDTYWSDHCRHTTFLTRLGDIKLQDAAVQRAFERYRQARQEVYGEGAAQRPVTLMDVATIGAKVLFRRGLTPNVDLSEEINACSIKIDVDVDGQTQPWLLMFKNETHNHPTEIEPFGGAATCIGGAIRDPLSGRTYVYQAMRVTGAADPLAPVDKTLPGKLPQRKLVTTAAAGYSSYGNQIGLATGLVDEVYHPGYAAKRLEIGAVVGAAPAEHVRRERPEAGDVIVLLGGRTGRDGCGGATGSSKSHDVSSIEACGAQVQKGNPPTERKLQRLFRDGDVARMIKRCNDFGAGGVSVAIGELADGLAIDLDKVLKKYEGLDGTELAISESQERMAVVLAPDDVPVFLAAAGRENLEATVVAYVTQEPRLRMRWRGKTIVDVSRAFLASNGAPKQASAIVEEGAPLPADTGKGSIGERLTARVSSLNGCAKKGLVERFDSTIGAATVLMPYGGERQLTPIQAMVAKLPVEKGETHTVSAMAYGLYPEIMERSPYEGSYLAVVESVTKLVCAGMDYRRAYLTLQEYFGRMTGDPKRWGKPLSALLGALDAQLDLGIAAIGGKDSMSGTFEHMDVPPTLCAFAVAPGDAREVISPEFKAAGHEIRLVCCDVHDTATLKANFDAVRRGIQSGAIVSAWAPGPGGIAQGLFMMGLGNAIGVKLCADFGEDLFAARMGAMLIECAKPCDLGTCVGTTVAEWALITPGERVNLQDVQRAWESRLDSVFPWRGREGERVRKVTYTDGPKARGSVHIARPTAFIPVFPGTNCEYDTARAVERAGGKADVLIIRNLTPQAIAESLAEARRRIAACRMIVLPGGFSGGDEPDGSAKFITAFFRNPAMREAVSDLLEHRDGLMLGICNGFQALVKLGLVPYGRIVEMDESCPTLTYNEIGRHQSMLVRTRVASNLSPWLSRCKTGDVHTVAISHGEGRFVAPQALLRSLAASGQIATQYVDLAGEPSMDMRFNPNGSMLAVEGITSPDGRVLGKMGHTERAGEYLYKNVPGDTYQPLFEGGMDYLR